MEAVDYKKKKKREHYYIKFGFYVLLICGVIIIIWGLFDCKHQVRILQFGEDAIGIITKKGFGKSSKKSSSPSYYIRFECTIDSVKYNLFKTVSKDEYDAFLLGQAYLVKYLPHKNPINNSMILCNKPIMDKFNDVPNRKLLQ